MRDWVDASAGEPLSSWNFPSKGYPILEVDLNQLQQWATPTLFQLYAFTPSLPQAVLKGCGSLSLSKSYHTKASLSTLVKKRTTERPFQSSTQIRLFHVWKSFLRTELPLQSVKVWQLWTIWKKIHSSRIAQDFCLWIRRREPSLENWLKWLVSMFNLSLTRESLRWQRT